MIVLRAEALIRPVVKYNIGASIYIVPRDIGNRSSCTVSAQFDIDGLGPKLSTNCLMWTMRDLSDIFLITKDDLAQLDRFGEVCRNLVRAIHTSKNPIQSMYCRTRFAMWRRDRSRSFRTFPYTRDAHERVRTARGYPKCRHTNGVASRNISGVLPTASW